jgi:hypothetical protein
MKLFVTATGRLALIAALFLCPAFNIAIASDEQTVFFEKGDAIYRLGSFPVGSWIAGHTGVYNRYDDYYLDPSSFAAHTVIESLPRTPAVDIRRFDSFYYSTTAFWGVRTLRELDYKSRRKIVQTANDQIGATFGYTKGYKHPGDGLKKGGVVSFRCDGLVEYCYEKALRHKWKPGDNGGIVPNDTWITLSPLRQKNYMHERTSAEEAALAPQEIQFIAPAQDGEHIRGTCTLTVFASDGVEGSGICGVEFWLGEPDGTPHEEPGRLIESYPRSRDNHNTAIGGKYEYDWDTNGVENGEYTLYAKAFDQAGNVGISEGRVVVVENYKVVAGIWMGKYSSWFDIPRYHPAGDYAVTIDVALASSPAEEDMFPADSCLLRTPTGKTYVNDPGDPDRISIGLTKAEFESEFIPGTYEITAAATINNENIEISDKVEIDSSIGFLEIPRVTRTSPPDGATIPPGVIDVTFYWRSVPGADVYYADFGSQGPPHVVYDWPGTSYTFTDVVLPPGGNTSSWSIYIAVSTSCRLPKESEIQPIGLTLWSVYWDSYTLTSTE